MATPHKKTLAPNEIIFRQGDLGDCAYLIESGRVAIFIERGNEEIPLRILGEGEVFGEMSLIDNVPRSASCRSVDRCNLIVVTKDQLLDRIKAADPVVRLLMKALLERLRGQNAILRNEVLAPSVASDPSVLDKKEALQRIGLENSLASALDEDEFIPYYQPIHSLKTKKIVGCEALIRWVTKDGQIISPASYMDVLEDSSLILQAGQIMIDKSLRDLPNISSQFKNSDFFVSINISGRQFSHPDFLAKLDESRNRAQVSSHQIKLELTERIMMDGPLALAALRQCRLKGYKLALDDFGTGFSSLQYLTQMPLTDLKIDRSFTSRMNEDQRSLSIVQTLIHMARLLGMNLIAEGIETLDQLKLYEAMGVEMGQGYLFDKPMPIEAFLKLQSQLKTG